jgi:hypothetical protein
MNYQDLKTLIREACPLVSDIIRMNDGRGMDGRLVSAEMEKTVIRILSRKLETKTEVEIPKDRNWFDILIGGIPINIKITTGGPDNAFNKVAVIYTLTDQQPEQKNMNFNQFYRYLLENPWKRERNPMKEYHYLVFDKNSGNFIFRSILDIEAMQSNPSNILQINWKAEFQRGEVAESSDPLQAGTRILQICQTSLKKALIGSEEFIKADIDVEMTLVNLGLDSREAPGCINAFDRF